MINWGIIGTGYIVGRFAASLKNEPRCKLAAVSSRTQQKADEFAKKISAEKAYAGHDLLLADEKIDAVYIALPHALHKEIAIRALKAGKAVLCEKPATLNFSEMEEIAAVARAEKKLFMEAMKPRFVPLYEKIKSAQAEIGEIISVETSLCNLMELTGKTYHTQKGQGGALLDVGIYCASWLEDFLGAVTDVKNITAKIENEIDYYVDAELNFGDKVGKLECAFDRKKPRQAVIHGTNGKIIVEELHRPQSMTLNDKIISAPYEVDDFFGEIKHFVNCLEAGKFESEIMPLSASLNCAKILEIIRSKF
ncbi:MAG: Gfo/Idh/MocA family oxidoreductase [Selenomonadaceae bacterium]|nr:Gfo/Idh/MocA family oxidoreductase [Selenomonadaceae bacterium]